MKLGGEDCPCVEERRKFNRSTTRQARKKKVCKKVCTGLSYHARRGHPIDSLFEDRGREIELEGGKQKGSSYDVWSDSRHKMERGNRGEEKQGSGRRTMVTDRTAWL